MKLCPDSKIIMWYGVLQTLPDAECVRIVLGGKNEKGKAEVIPVGLRFCVSVCVVVRVGCTWKP